MTKTKKTTKTKRQPIADPEGMNKDRASWALAAVETFRAETGMDSEDLDTVVGDLLADLAHLCDERGLDFGHLIWRADMHYTAETSSEDSENAEEVDGKQFNRIDVGRAED